MDNAGNLGIGTASPTAKLDVKGLAGGFGLRVQADDGDGLAGTRPRQLVIHGNTNANLKAEIGFDTTAKVMVISAVEEGVSWRNIGFANNGGSVGIGTTTPTAKLHVAGPGGSSVDFIVNGRMRSDNNDGGLWVQSNRFIGGHGASKMGFYNGGAWRLTVDSAGNTGIGTTSPTHLLTVNGTIRAEEVIVEAGIAAAEVRIRPQAWADDVFAPGYALPTVDDVAAYIEAAGHLPGVPSAATVADQGVALGEMQKTLLRKVEELTLYVIELKRENAELRSRVDNLAQRN